MGMRDFAMDTSRGLAAAGVPLSAVVHLDLWQRGIRDIDAIGSLFLVNAVGGSGTLLWQSMRERTS